MYFIESSLKKGNFNYFVRFAIVFCLQINIARRENHIYVKGSDIPDLAETFSDLQERY